ncbi:ankyrin repeat domain-containing protein [Wolbachia endosymbiont (group B) of Schoenobius gigantella]|uniref:ankyrin repeat domain-containing protein n=1 Tax=Wolbachia endosymbiont (group B) of Schoenobius gigantella TaxID=3139313 RepID=UPI003CCB1B39
MDFNLYIKNNILTLDGVTVNIGKLVSFLQANIHVTRLSLENSEIGNEGVKSLANVTSLTELSLSNNDISNEGVEALSDSTSLTKLKLPSNRISSKGVKALTKLQNVTELDLSRNDVGDEGAEALANLQNLVFLNLADNPISDKGAKALTSLKKLTVLYLPYNKVSNEGVKALANLQNLTELYLWNNEIGDEGAKALVNLPHLTALNLSYNRVNQTTLDKLENKLEDRGRKIEQESQIKIGKKVELNENEIESSVLKTTIEVLENNKEELFQQEKELNNVKGNCNQLSQKKAPLELPFKQFSEMPKENREIQLIISRLKKENIELRSAIEDFKKQNIGSSMESQNLLLKKKNAELEEWCAIINSDRDNILSELNNLRKEMEEKLEERMLEAYKKNKKLQQQVKRLNEDLQVNNHINNTNIELTKLNKKLELEVDSFLLQLNNTERELKDGKVTIEKLREELYKIHEENKRLEQKIKKSDEYQQEAVEVLYEYLQDDDSIDNSTINRLQNELKDKESKIQFTDTLNEQLQERLEQSVDLINWLTSEKKYLENLVKELSPDNNKDSPKSEEPTHIRSLLNQSKLENQDSIRELNILQKGNKDLKFKLQKHQPGRSSSEESSKTNTKVDRLTQTEIDYDRCECNQRGMHKKDELLDEGYYSSFEQESKWKSSTGQECSEIGSPKTEATELPVDSYYEFIKRDLFWADRSLIDDKKYLEDLIDEWLIHAPNLKLEESQKELNQKLLNSIIKDFNMGNYDSFSNLKQFLESNEKNEDLKRILNLKRGHLGTTILNVFLECDEVIPSLLKAGADLNMKDNKGKTLLHDTAIYSSGYEDVGYLLDAKADPNIQDEKGNTPLHYYAAKCSDHSRKTMGLLISKGADLSIKNNDGKTPLQVAIDNDNIIGCLLKNNQKKLREQLGEMLLATSSDEDWDSAYDPGVESLRKFLNQYENDKDLKIVLNVKDDSSILLDWPSCQFPNVKALLLKAGADDFIGNKQDNYEKCDSFLSEIYQINHLAKRNEFSSKVVKAKSMIELQEVVNEVISSGIRLNLAKGEECYCTDEILEKIVQLEENYEIASNIVCTLISRGAKLKRSKSLKVIDTIELKFKAHKANMIRAHLEYVSNAEESFRVAKDATSGQLYDGKIDNNVSYLEYSEDSIIDIARITDRTRNLELIQGSYRRDIIKIGKSEVEIITQNGIRNYTDLTEGSSIVLTFYTSLGNIDVRLYPDVEDKSKIIVEVSNKEEVLEKFKGREEELGNDCELGNYWVYDAIEQGYFERSGGSMRPEVISESNNKWTEREELRRDSMEEIARRHKLLQDLRNIKSNIVKKEKNFDVKTYLIDIFKILSRFYEEKGDISKTDLAKAAEKESKKLGLEGKYNWSKIFGLEEEIIEKAEKQGDKEQKSNIPDDFYLGHAINNGSCFFDSFRQSMEQQKGIKVTVEQLRNECKRFAQDNPPDWFISKIGKDFDEVEGDFVNRGITCNQYINSIGKNEFWGRSDVEGRVLCSKYGVKLHVAESNPFNATDEQQDPYLHQLIDSSGSRSAGEYNRIDYDDNNVLHIVNKGSNHFQPLPYRNKALAKQTQEQKDSLCYSSLPSCSMDELKIEKASHQQKALLVSRP